MRIVWLASYPKSGNTWLRHLLHEYLVGPVTSSASLDRQIPDLHRYPGLDADAPVDRFVKTHFRWSPEHPYAAHTIAAIHVVRHPKDVLLSTLDYFTLYNGDDAPAIDPKDYIRQWIDHAGDPTWLDKGFGTPLEHATSWQRGAQCLTIRYEDLKADTARTLARVLVALGQNIDEARVDRAIARSALGALQSLERTEKAASGSAHPGTADQFERGQRFFNQARTTASLAHIDRDLDAAFDEAFAPLLQHLGYRTATAAA